MKRSVTRLYHSIQWLGGQRRATVVVYHSISAPPNRYTVTPAAFERQIRYLRDHYEIVRLRDLPAALDEPAGHRLKVAITFDDALVDFQENAFGVLKALRVPVTMFVPTGLMGRTNEWDADSDLPTRAIMSREQILALKGDELIDFGSHSITHRSMAELGEPEMRVQAKRSQQVLEELLGVPITMFAYPYGGYRNFSRRTTQILRDAGYGLAVTTVWGTRQWPRNPLTLRRVSLSDSDTDEDVRSKVNGDHDWRGVRQGAGHALRTLKQLASPPGMG